MTALDQLVSQISATQFPRIKKYFERKAQRGLQMYSYEMLFLLCLVSFLVEQVPTQFELCEQESRVFAKMAKKAYNYARDDSEGIKVIQKECQVPDAFASLVQLKDWCNATFCKKFDVFRWQLENMHTNDLGVPILVEFDAMCELEGLVVPVNIYSPAFSSVPKKTVEEWIEFCKKEQPVLSYTAIDCIRFANTLGSLSKNLVVSKTAMSNLTRCVALFAKYPRAIKKQVTLNLTVQEYTMKEFCEFAICIFEDNALECLEY